MVRFPFGIVLGWVGLRLGWPEAPEIYVRGGCYGWFLRVTRGRTPPPPHPASLAAHGSKGPRVFSQARLGLIVLDLGLRWFSMCLWEMVVRFPFGIVLGLDFGWIYVHSLVYECLRFGARRFLGVGGGCGDCSFEPPPRILSV